MHHLERTKAGHKAPDRHPRRVAEVTKGDQDPALSPQLLTRLRERGHRLGRLPIHQELQKAHQGRDPEHQGEEERSTILILWLNLFCYVDVDRVRVITGKGEWRRYLLVPVAEDLPHISEKRVKAVWQVGVVSHTHTQKGRNQRQRQKEELSR